MKYWYDGREFTREDMNEWIEPILDGSALTTNPRLAKTLPLAEGPRVLDVGCAVGAFSYLLAKRNPGWTVKGIDLLSESIKIAKEYFHAENLSFETRDLFTKRFPANSFDCILFLETLEHVGNPEAFLQEFHRILSPNGCLIISTPNALSWWNHARHSLQDMRKRLERVKNEPKDTGTQDDHITTYDALTLTRLLDRNGFRFQDYTYADGFGSLSKTVIVKAIKGKDYESV